MRAPSWFLRGSGAASEVSYETNARLRARAAPAPFDEQPRNGVARGDEVLQEPVERVLPAEDVAAAHIVAREDEGVGVLERDEGLEEGRPVRVRAGKLLLRRRDVLAKEVARVCAGAVARCG